MALLFQIQSQYIRDLYKSIDKGCDLPPPSGLTGPSGDILIDLFDPRLYKTIKKLNKHRKKLLKENKLRLVVNPPSERDPLIDSADIKIVPPEVKVIKIVKINQPDNNLKELDDPELFDDFQDVPDQIIAKNDGRNRTRTRLRSISITPVKRRALTPTRATRNLTKIAIKKTLDELSKEIEKEKRLVILLEPLTANISRVKIESPFYSDDNDELFKPSEFESGSDKKINSDDDDNYEPPSVRRSTRKKKRSRITITSDSDDDNVIRSSKKKKTRKSHKKSFKKTSKKGKIYEKKLCPYPKCEALIAWNIMAIHLNYHKRMGNNIIIRPKNRPINKNETESQICPFCGQQNFKSLENHIKVAHGDSNSKSILTKILQHKKPLKSVCCSICLENFEDEKSNQYFLHMKTHDLNWKISCTFCKDNFSNFGDYTDHINNFHPYQCPILECNEAFSNLINFKEHMREKHLEKCKEFGVSVNIQRNNYMCTYCPTTYNAPNKLTDHLIMHEDPDAVTCTLCPTKKIFKSKKLFDLHMIYIHGEKTLPCTFKGCLKMFSSEKYLREHLALHDPNSSRSTYAKLKKQIQWWKDPTIIYKCTTDGCDKEYTNDTNSRLRYLNHVSVFHPKIDQSSKQEIFNCPIEFCPAKSENKKAINIHIKLEHAEHANDFVKNAEKKFKCSYCERSYNYQHALKDHELSHTDPAQTTCDICNKLFNSKTMKNIHLKEAHGSKEFKCSFPNCPSIFSTEVFLRRHIKVTHHKK